MTRRQSGRAVCSLGVACLLIGLTAGVIGIVGPLGWLRLATAGVILLGAGLLSLRA